MILLLFLLFPVLIQGQERQNDQLPIVNLVAEISEMTGWTKNDIGEWHSGRNSLPNIQHEAAVLNGSCEGLLKISLFRVSQDQQNFYCFAKFSRHFYRKWGKLNTEFVCNYWLFKAQRPDTSVSDDGRVISICYKTIGQDIIIKSVPITQTYISEHIMMGKDKDNSVMGNFCVQSRSNNKGKTQFLAGSYNSEINTYSLTDCLMSDNDQLTHAYYEVNESTFHHLFDQIR